MIHNTCNMAIRDLPDMYTLIPRACGPRTSGIHIRQIPHGHVTTITCNVLLFCCKEHNKVCSNSYLKIYLNFTKAN